MDEVDERTSIALTSASHKVCMSMEQGGLDSHGEASRGIAAHGVTVSKALGRRHDFWAWPSNMMPMQII